MKLELTAEKQTSGLLKITGMKSTTFTSINYTFPIQVNELNTMIPSIFYMMTYS